MDQLELEELDSNDPPVNCGTQLNIRIFEHSLDVVFIDFHPKIFDANNVKSVSLEGMPKTINLNLCLRVARFPFIPGDRTKQTRVPFVICTELQENKTSGNARGIDGENDASIRVIVDGTKTRGCDDCLLQILHGLFLIWAPDKIHVLFCQNNEGLFL